MPVPNKPGGKVLRTSILIVFFSLMSTNAAAQASRAEVQAAQACIDKKLSNDDAANLRALILQSGPLEYPQPAETSVEMAMARSRVTTAIQGAAIKCVYEPDVSPEGLETAQERYLALQITLTSWESSGAPYDKIETLFKAVVQLSNPALQKMIDVEGSAAAWHALANGLPGYREATQGAADVPLIDRAIKVTIHAQLASRAE